MAEWQEGKVKYKEYDEGRSLLWTFLAEVVVQDIVSHDSDGVDLWTRYGPLKKEKEFELEYNIKKVKGGWVINTYGQDAVEILDPKHMWERILECGLLPQPDVVYTTDEAASGGVYRKVVGAAVKCPNGWLFWDIAGGRLSFRLFEP